MTIAGMRFGSQRNNECTIGNCSEHPTPFLRFISDRLTETLVKFGERQSIPHRSDGNSMKREKLNSTKDLKIQLKVPFCLGILTR